MARKKISATNKIKYSLIKCFILVNGILLAQNDFQLKPGDLLFQDSDCGELCDAIETVTPGIYNANLTHVGIVDTLKGEWVVLEAISEGVTHTALESFLDRSSDSSGYPKVIVGRLKKPYQKYIPKALALGRTNLGKPYDNIYILGDSSLYCSELVYHTYLDSINHPMFKLWPMTFKAPGDTSFFPSWTKYYQKLNHPVPEGKPGLNPGSISMSEILDIIHIYGYPDGWNKPEQP